MTGVDMFSLSEFRKEMSKRNMNDKNADWFKGLAIISICGTFHHKDSIVDSDIHYFSRCHDNVLNLRFDDVYYDCNIRVPEMNIVWYRSLRPISIADARKTVDFIKKNQHRHFIIHSLYAKSRGPAIAKAIQIIKQQNINDFDEKYQCTPNPIVFKRLYAYL